MDKSLSSRGFGKAFGISGSSSRRVRRLLHLGPSRLLGHYFAGPARVPLEEGVSAMDEKSGDGQESRELELKEREVRVKEREIKSVRNEWTGWSREGHPAVHFETLGIN